MTRIRSSPYGPLLVIVSTDRTTVYWVYPALSQSLLAGLGVQRFQLYSAILTVLGSIQESLLRGLVSVNRQVSLVSLLDHQPISGGSGALIEHPLYSQNVNMTLGE